MQKFISLAVVLLISYSCKKPGFYDYSKGFYDNTYPDSELFDNIQDYKDKDYNQIISNDEELVKCYNDDDLFKQPALAGLFSDMDVLKKHVNMSCDKLCPRSQAILGPIPPQTVKDKENNHLSYGNPYGKCRGMSKITQRFMHMAVWDKGLDQIDQKFNSKLTQEDPFPPKCKIPSNITDYKCRNYYKEVIKDMMHPTNPKVRILPHFGSLAEFSAHPTMARYLHSIEKGISSSFKFRRYLTKKPDPNFMKKLKKRVKSNQTVNIGIRLKYSTVGHAITAYGVAKKIIDNKEQEVVCIIDPNSSSNNTGCKNYFYNDGRTIKYSNTWSSRHGLGDYYVTSNENAMTLKLIDTRVKFCKLRNYKACEPNKPTGTVSDDNDDSLEEDQQ